MMQYKNHKPKKEITCDCGRKTTKQIKGKCQLCYQKLKEERKASRRQYDLI